MFLQSWSNRHFYAFALDDKFCLFEHAKLINTSVNTSNYFQRIFDDSESHLKKAFGDELFCKNLLKILANVLEKNLGKSYIFKQAKM